MRSSNWGCSRTKTCKCHLTICKSDLTWPIRRSHWAHVLCTMFAAFYLFVEQWHLLSEVSFALPSTFANCPVDTLSALLPSLARFFMTPGKYPKLPQRDSQPCRLLAGNCPSTSVFTCSEPLRRSLLLQSDRMQKHLLWLCK